MRSSNQARELLLELYQAALAAVEGGARVRGWLNQHALPDRLHVIALGKAAPAMARGAYEVLGERILDALIVTKQGYSESLPWPCLEGGHPVPDAASLQAGTALLQFVERIPHDCHVLLLLSGGASAVVEALPAGVSLQDLAALNQWLLARHVAIHDCNRLRKRLSQIKGGRLAQRIAPRRTTVLALSDVLDDDPATIGSGPCTADDASAVLPTGLPEALADCLSRAAPLPMANDPAFTLVDYHVIGNHMDARLAAAGLAKRKGVAVEDDTRLLTGPADTLGRECARHMRALVPGTVWISGGESTVSLPAQPGKGGRCQHAALAAAQELAAHPAEQGVVLFGATDGSDGPGEDAGAMVDAETVIRGSAAGLDAAASLAAADSGSFLEASGDLIHTGPTGSNVMDLLIAYRI